MNSLLLISDTYDTSTDKVVAYLLKPFTRLNVDELNYTGLTKLINHNFKDFTIWLRRGDFFKLFASHLIKHLETEFKSFVDYLFFLYSTDAKKTIGSLKKDYDHNKLIDLKLAKKFGLNVPETFIHNSNLPNNYKKDAIYITKMNKAAISVKLENVKLQTGLTTEIDKNFIDNEKSVFPSVIQEKIEKEFELRTFFFEDNYYSMAIFSQKDPTTAIDYRNYNQEKSNRMVPFKLPKPLLKKLKKLMIALDLNTGSIDLIYSKNGKFYFLEVNPCGQFDWVSVNCNYIIEEDIANTLSK